MYTHTHSINSELLLMDNRVFINLFFLSTLLLEIVFLRLVLLFDLHT